MAVLLVLLISSFTLAPGTASSISINNSSDLLLKPNTSSSRAREAALILVPAPQMLPAQYAPLAQSVQQASVGALSLWVLLAASNNTTSMKPEDIGSLTDRAVAELESHGFKKGSPIFLAVHSQTRGSLVQDYVASSSLRHHFTGLVLLGAFLKRSFHSTPFPVPTLVLGGELDGVCRVSRIMEEYVHRIHDVENRTEAIRSFPVAVIRGMTHMQFSSGTPSDAVTKYDLKPEITDAEARLNVSLLTARFVETRLGNSSSLSVLEAAVQQTGQFLQPLIQAYTWEGSYLFRPPCNEAPPTPSCQVGCTWTQKAMTIMAELKQVQINDTDAFHPASEIFPAIHHPKISSRPCPTPDASCTVSLTSVSQNIYYKDASDSGLVPNAACEIRAKLKSRQSVMMAAGFKNVDFNTSDAGSRCKAINQLAYSWALNRSDVTTRSRFDRFGTPMVMGEDKGCFHNGGLWIYMPMEYKLPRDSGKLEISSIQLKTDVKYPIGMFQGMHFCKLLSPAKAMEWIYVDGLRAHYSLSGESPTFPSCGL